MEDQGKRRAYWSDEVVKAPGSEGWTDEDFEFCKGLLVGLASAFEKRDTALAEMLRELSTRGLEAIGQLH